MLHGTCNMRDLTPSAARTPALRSRLTGRSSEGKKEDRPVRKLIACGVALIAALALTVPGALGGAEQTPGVTARTIVVGGTLPLTGPAAAYAPIVLGLKTSFTWINARRGPERKRGVSG